jgi:hypothetical protein
LALCLIRHFHMRETRISETGNSVETSPKAP